LVVKAPPPQNRRKRGGKGEFTTGGNTIISSLSPATSPTEPASPTATPTIAEQPPQLTTEEVLEKISQMEPAPDPNVMIQSENMYCPDCYLPLHPDPKPEKLYIFLHALKYSTSLGPFETEMPEWTAEGYEWDRT
jgi:tRNA pseudouridine synthase 9